MKGAEHIEFICVEQLYIMELVHEKVEIYLHINDAMKLDALPRLKGDA